VTADASRWKELATCALAFYVSACCSLHRAEVHALPMRSSNPTTAVLPVAPQDVVACWRKFRREPHLSIRTESEAKTVGSWTTFVSANADQPRADWPSSTGPYDATVYMGLGDDAFSDLYVDERGKNLPYGAEFLVHVAALPDARTRVEVTTRGSAVIVGDSYSWHVFRCLPLKEEPVPPTTIDEYRLILRLAECLGVERGMPPLILPTHKAGQPSRQADGSTGTWHRCASAGLPRSGG
jgi:hypothetical protein